MPSRRQAPARRLEFLLQQAHAVDVLAQAPPGLVARQGWLAHDQRAAERSSSSRMRCEMADGVTFSARAARSKLPSRITAAKAESAA